MKHNLFVRLKVCKKKSMQINILTFIIYHKKGEQSADLLHLNKTQLLKSMSE